MTETGIGGPVEQYRQWWLEVGKKFAAAIALGFVGWSVLFLAALYLVIRVATAHGYADYAERMMR